MLVLRIEIGSFEGWLCRREDQEFIFVQVDFEVFLRYLRKGVDQYKNQIWVSDWEFRIVSISCFLVKYKCFFIIFVLVIDSNIQIFKEIIGEFWDLNNVGIDYV